MFPCHISLRIWLATVAGICFLSAGDVGNKTNAPAPALRIFAERTPRGLIERAVLQSGSTQLSFVTPNGYLCASEASGGMVRLGNQLSKSTVTIKIEPSGNRETAELTATGFRDSVVTQYPNARVVDEFPVTVCGWPGRAVEISSLVQPTVTNALRIARVPFSGGAVVVTLEAKSDTIRGTDQAFNELLLSLRAGLDGKAPEPQKFLSEL